VTALYRKYRPQDFDEVVGQEPVVRTLKNAIAAGQVRQAYLIRRRPRRTADLRRANRASDAATRGHANPVGLPHLPCGDRVLQRSNDGLLATTSSKSWGRYFR